MSNENGKKPYAIGYGKPPEGKKFPKGQSGNPAGRPRKSLSEPIPTSTRTTILDIMQRQITIREGEETRKISTKEAVIRAQVATALKGNPLAQREITHLTMRCEKEAEEARWDDYFFWADYKERNEILIAKGHPADEIFPHPDDIILHENGNVTFNGPTSHEHKELLDIVMRQRDAFFMRGIWESLRLRDEDPDDITSRVTLHLQFSQWMDMTLPPRLRWEKDKIDAKMLHYAFLTDRELKSRLKRTWLEVFQNEPDLSRPPRSLKQLAQAYGHPTFEVWMEHCRNNPVSNEEYQSRLCKLELRIAQEEARQRPRRYRARKSVAAWPRPL